MQELSYLNCPGAPMAVAVAIGIPGLTVLALLELWPWLPGLT